MSEAVRISAEPRSRPDLEDAGGLDSARLTPELAEHPAAIEDGARC